MDSETPENKCGSIEKKAGVSAPFYGFLLALSFLTRIPVNCRFAGDERVWKWSAAFYPVCGYVIGFVSALPLFVFSFYGLYFEHLFILLAASFMYVALNQWMTRMLHLDGFCDCVDAFSKVTLSKEKRLEIMKDPHTGSSAAGASAILFIAKTMTVYLLIKKYFLVYNDITYVFIAMIFIPALARLAMLYLAAAGNYPREDGTGFNIVGKIPRTQVVFGTLTLLPLLVFIPFVTFFICFFSTMLAMLFWKFSADSKLGGVTGDVLGACCETAEVTAAIGFLIP